MVTGDKKFGKYARPEIERTFLVATLPPGSIFQAEITDHYIPQTTLRVRCMQTTRETIWKLGQKIRLHPHETRVILHTSIYLTDVEYQLLIATLPAHCLTKRRFRLSAVAFPMVVDQFQGPLEGLVMAEVDVGPDGDPSSFPRPAFALAEVTDDERFTGARLAVTTRPQVQALLAEFNVK